MCWAGEAPPNTPFFFFSPATPGESTLENLAGQEDGSKCFELPPTSKRA